MAGLAAMLALEIAFILLATHGHFVYALEAPYTHLAVAQQIAQGNYGLVPGETAAPSSSILYPFLLAALQPLGLGALLPLAITLASTLAGGVLAVLLVRECGIQLQEVSSARLFVVTAVVAIALDLPGLAATGLEHSLHIATTVACLLGLVRFLMRGRAEWWWFACIIAQPMIRFEAVDILVVTVLILIALQSFRYASALAATGLLLLVGYLHFVHSLRLPLLPSSVLARSDWSYAAVVSHGSVISVAKTILKNLHANLITFGASQMLGGVALGLAWLGRTSVGRWRRDADKSDQVRMMTLVFMTLVTVAQLAGGKLGWVPPRYEAYVLVLNLCGLAVIFHEGINAWCQHANWPRVAAICSILLLVFAGYVAQFAAIPAMARKEYQGPFQLHRFVTEYYRAPVAVDQLGYVNFDNPDYVLDLSGLGSEPARAARSDAHSAEWMDKMLGSHDVGLALIDATTDPNVPAEWIRIGDLHHTTTDSGEADHRVIFYARRPGDIAAISSAMDRFAPTLPEGVSLTRNDPAAEDASG